MTQMSYPSNGSTEGGLKTPRNQIDEMDKHNLA